jgi:hypothetical protein
MSIGIVALEWQPSAMKEALDSFSSSVSHMARFYRGLAFLRLIQPDLHEFFCQDKLRSDSAADLMHAAVNFDLCGI